MSKLVNKLQLVKYLNSLVFTCPVPRATKVCYIYFRYSLDHTYYLRITVIDCTVNTIRSIASGLLHLEQTQPNLDNAAAFFKVLKGAIRCLDMLGVTDVSIEPVRYCEMLECSGLVVTSLSNDTLADGQFAPTVDVYDRGKLVFTDHISWLFMANGTKLKGDDE